MPSTVISYFTYNSETEVLRIRFVSGLIYDYKDVPEQVYIAMKESRSKGVFFNKYIKDKYQFTKIGE